MPPASKRPKPRANKPVSPEQHFEAMKKKLYSLGSEERMTDLRFNCHFGGQTMTIFAHRPILARHSQILRDLFDIASKEQLSEPVTISLMDIPPAAVKKLLEYMYTGTTNVTPLEKEQLSELVNVLGIDIELQDSPEVLCEIGEEENIVKEPTRKSPEPIKSPEPERESPEQERKSPETDRKSPESEAPEPPVPERANKSPSVESRKSLEPSEKEEEKKEDDEKPDEGHARKVLPNPLFAQQKKRKLPESDKRTSAAPNSKKARESDSESSEDAEKLEHRKREILPATKIGLKKKDEDAKSDEKVSTPRIKKKIGPKSKTRRVSSAGGHSSDNPEPRRKSVSDPKDDMFLTEMVLPCKKCSSIFVSKDALQSHVKKVHSSAAKDDGSSDSDGKTPAKRPGPKKRTASKIREEREMSKKKTVDPPDSDSEDNEPKKEKPKVLIGPKSAKKKREESNSRGHKEESRKSHKEEAKKEKPKSGIALVRDSLKKKHREEMRDEVTPKKREGFKSPSRPECLKSEKKSRRPSVRGDDGLFHCNFCTESFDKVGNLKNHVLNHFKAQLLEDLPPSKPFLCPVCGAESRDKITLMRHYATTHKVIYKYCSEDDLKGRPSSKTPKLDTSTASKSGGEEKLKKKKKIQRPVSSSSSSSSDSDNSSKKSNASKGKEASNKSAEKSDSDKFMELAQKEYEAQSKLSGDELNKPENGTASPELKKPDKPLFSDSEDEVIERASNAAQKSFDDLFGKTSDNEKEEGNGGPVSQGVPVFNADSDGEANT